MKKKFHYKKSEDSNVQISKALTYYLRHGAEKEGIKIRPDGYVFVDELFQMPNLFSKHITYDKLKEIVDTNEKKRFELQEFKDPTTNKPQLFIRATQGHTIKSIDDELLLTKLEDCEGFSTVIHGSYLKNWDLIRKEGLKTMTRNHIHLAPGYPGENEVISGMRNNCSLYIEIDMEKAMKDGIVFYLSKNNVILTSGLEGVVPPKYFKQVKDKKNRVLFDNKGGFIEIEEEKKEDIHPKENNKNMDLLDYLLVLDFEAQCDQNGKEKKNLEIQEIIEFPIVPINMKTGAIEKEHIFHHYIKPVNLPKLTEFCMSLTGITQEQVDKGVILEEALELLHAYLVKTEILNKKWCFVTCGDWDIHTCLRNEAKKKNIILRDYMKNWINVKRIFQTETKKSRGFGMTDMLEHFKLDLDGRHHSGIDDSLNIGKVVLKLIEGGVKFTSKLINDYKH